MGGVYFPKEPVWVSFGFNMLQLIALATLPPLFVHLSLTFPRRDPLMDRLRWLMPTLFTLAVGLDPLTPLELPADNRITPAARPAP